MKLKQSNSIEFLNLFWSVTSLVLWILAQQLFSWRPMVDSQLCILKGKLIKSALKAFYSFSAKLPKITYCYSAKQFWHYSKLSITMVTIVDFGAFFGRRLKSTMAPKELNKFVLMSLHCSYYFLDISAIILTWVCFGITQIILFWDHSNSSVLGTPH